MTRRIGRGRLCTRARDERGFVGGGEVVLAGVVIMVMTTLVVINLWSVIDAKGVVTAASGEAARTVVESNGPEGRERARATATEIMQRRKGLESPQVLVNDAGFGRCARATITVSANVPLFGIPHWAWMPQRVRVRSTHSEVIDPYRSGLHGEALCGADAGDE